MEPAEQFLSYIALLRDQTGSHIEEATAGIQNFLQNPESSFVLCSIIQNSQDDVVIKHCLIYLTQIVANIIKNTSEEFVQNLLVAILALFKPELIELCEMLANLVRAVVTSLDKPWIQIQEFCFQPITPPLYSLSLFEHVIIPYYPDCIYSNLDPFIVYISNLIQTDDDEYLFKSVLIITTLVSKKASLYVPLKPVIQQISENFVRRISSGDMSGIRRVVFNLTVDFSVCNELFFSNVDYQLLLEKLVDSSIPFEQKQQYLQILTSVLSAQIDAIPIELVNQILDFQLAFTMEAYSRDNPVSNIIDFALLVKFLFVLIPSDNIQEMILTKFQDLLNIGSVQSVTTGLILMTAVLRYFPTYFTENAEDIFNMLFEGLTSDDMTYASYCAYLLATAPELFSILIKANFLTYWEAASQFIENCTDILYVEKLYTLFTNAAPSDPEITSTLIEYFVNLLDNQDEVYNVSDYLFNIIRISPDISGFDELYANLIQLMAQNFDVYYSLIKPITELLTILPPEFFVQNVVDYINCVKLMLQSTNLMCVYIALKSLASITNEILPLGQQIQEIVQIIFPFAEKFTKSCAENESAVYKLAFQVLINIAVGLDENMLYPELGLSSPENVARMIIMSMQAVEANSADAEQAIGLCTMILSRLYIKSMEQDPNVLNALQFTVSVLCNCDTSVEAIYCLEYIFATHSEMLADENIRVIILTKMQRILSTIMTSTYAMDFSSLQLCISTIFIVFRFLRLIESPEIIAHFAEIYLENLYQNLNNETLPNPTRLVNIYFIMNFYAIDPNYVPQENALQIDKMLQSFVQSPDILLARYAAQVLNSMLDYNKVNFQYPADYQEWISIICERINATEADVNTQGVILRETLLCSLIRVSINEKLLKDADTIKMIIHYLVAILPIRHEYGVMMDITSCIPVLDKFAPPDLMEPLYKKLIIQFAIPKSKRDKFEIEEAFLMSISTQIRKFLESLGENAGSYLQEIFGDDTISLDCLRSFLAEMMTYWQNLQIRYETDLPDGEVIDFTQNAIGQAGEE